VKELGELGGRQQHAWGGGGTKILRLGGLASPAQGRGRLLPTTGRQPEVGPSAEAGSCATGAGWQQPPPRGPHPTAAGPPAMREARPAA
jgi:hypothetical protein